MDATKENLLFPQFQSPFETVSRTISIDLTLEPFSDISTSTVVVIEPVKSLLVWTIIEAVALGFFTTVALNTFRSHHGYSFVPEQRIITTFHEDLYKVNLEKFSTDQGAKGASLRHSEHFPEQMNSFKPNAFQQQQIDLCSKTNNETKIHKLC